jgi:Zn-finger nucleic acid-binding protein
MECPKCQARLEPVEYGGVEIDRCVRCGGLWFDPLEHEELRKLAGSESLDTGPTWLADVHNRQERSFCPRDRALMMRMVDPAQPDIWFESCPVCHGTFFDAGEFRDWKDRTLGEFLYQQLRGRHS